MRTSDDIRLVEGIGHDLAAQGVGYAEVAVTPVVHHRAGLAWVYDISGFNGLDGARARLDTELRHPPPDLVGFANPRACRPGRGERA
jgi:hypothetical protein